MYADDEVIDMNTRPSSSVTQMKKLHFIHIKIFQLFFERYLVVCTLER